MPGVSETRQYDALLTTTLANFRKKMMDNVFDYYALLSWMNGKLGVALRGEGGKIKEIQEGGESIIEHITYEMNTTVNSYSGSELLDTSLQEGMTIARFNWKNYSGAVGITGTEKRANRGEAAMIKLWEAKVKQLEGSIRDRLSRDAFGDGTGNGSKNLTGLATLISATTTLGGLSPTTYPTWASTVTSSAGSFATNGIPKMRTMFNTLSYGNDKPDIIFTDQSTYEYYESQAADILRPTDTRIADVGFESMKYKAVPLMFDRDCTAGYMYFLNSNALKFKVMEGADFDMQPAVTRDDQDATTALMLLQCNVTTNERRKLGVITGFTA